MTKVISIRCNRNSVCPGGKIFRSNLLKKLTRKQQNKTAQQLAILYQRLCGKYWKLQRK